MEPGKFVGSQRQDAISADKRIKCSHCNYASSYMGHLKVHMRTHENTKSKKSYISSSESSILEKHNEKTYKCSPCNYWCTGAERMKRHMKSHNTVESILYCTLCNYASANARDIRAHTIAHKSLFENPPSVAERKRKHARRINGKKPNKCNRCNYTSSCGSNLRAHMFFYHFFYFISGQS